MPFVSSAVFVPQYTNLNPQNRTICGNMPSDINTWLSVTDIDPGQTLTWSILAQPSHGTLGGFTADEYSAPSGGSMVTPMGLTYTSDGTFSTDAFTIMVSDGVDGSVTMTVLLTINDGPSLTLGAFPAVCKGVTSATIPFSGLTHVGPDTVIFSYTGGLQTWTVPANVTSIKFDAMGASGGNDDFSGAPNPGLGGRIQGVLSVFPGNMLNLYVGGRGGDGSPLGATGGYNGGGDAFYYFFGGGGAGGGATDIRIGGTALANRKVVAGGGGGNGADNSPVLTAYAGGAGGGLSGGNGGAFNSSAARGGTQSAGGNPSTYTGWSSGSVGTSGRGGNGSVQGVSGGGGGGYFGGGGGVWSGGGGGSSYAEGATTYSVTHAQGVNDGNGSLKIYYTNPGTYTIIWDNTADVVGGFENVASAALPAGSEFTIAVPAGAPADTYHGTLTINNVNCNSVSYPIEVTVKPLPDVITPADQVLCHGDSTADVFLSGSVSGGSYTWVNDNPAIGLDPAGSGHIPAFLPINGTPIPVTANITITPQADGCIGTPVVFHIVDNPVPALNSTATPAGICNNTLFSYIPTSLTPGTSFNWSRATVAGIVNPGTSGSDNPNETLLNSTTDPITVTYVYTLTSSTCDSIVNVSVVVNPTPVLTSTHAPAALCNSQVFNYTPTSSSAGATLTWSRPIVSGISNAAASGSGAISETLLNTTTTPKIVTYVITLSIGGCNYTEDVVVVVNPPLVLTSITALTPKCDSQVLNYIPTTAISGASLNWSRPAITGISNPAATGVGNISEALVNTTPDPIVVTYIYTIGAFGCTNNQNVTITVNPRPKLSSSLTPPDICTNTLFMYTPTSLTAGATFVWARDVVVGISNPASVVTPGSVNELLVNYTDTTINVLYLYTTTANGCANSDKVWVKVNPLPRISNDISALAVCDSALIGFVPTSITPGASFSWTRAYEAGISNPNSAGTGGPNERLNNTTYISVPATYVYTITANGCSNSQSVIIQVRPSAVLVSNTATTCSGAPFTYVPVSYTTLADFAWSRTNSTGITPPSRSGVGNIVDTLTQTTTAPVNVVYDFELSIFGCINPQKVTVTVQPAPGVPVIGIHPAADLCNNVTAMNFGAATPSAEDLSYSWSATNAIVLATGSTKQYALVTFNTPGTATVRLTSKIGSTTCISHTDYVVNVGNSSAETPSVIYFDGQFICRQTEQASYQWGYDDATTLDSTILVGETNQNYANQYPDFMNRYYWIMTTRNGCLQKTYYNKPTGVVDIDNSTAAIRIYPNPANQFINVEVNGIVSGDIKMDVFNMLGQQITSVTARNNKAMINIADLPAGAYIVDCYSNGSKVAAARFIKN